jgi:chorismate--pyruvate lyase
VTSLSGNKDPHWRPQHAYSQARLPHLTKHWLLDEGSLTEHLQRESGGAFRVQRLQQRWQIPLPSERRLLGLSARQSGLVREVALLCEGKPWVFARSVIPVATLRGPLRQLRHLGNESLGALIFRNPKLGRSSFELAILPVNSPYIDVSLRQNKTAWARRSRFEVQGKKLLVSEVFLDAFRPWSTGVRSV